MSYKGRIRNGVVVLDTPANLPEGAEVEVRAVGTNGHAIAATPSESSDQTASLFERYQSIIGIADGLPADFAENHDHYIHGTPKTDE